MNSTVLGICRMIIKEKSINPESRMSDDGFIGIHVPPAHGCHGILAHWDVSTNLTVGFIFLPRLHLTNTGKRFKFQTFTAFQ